MGNTQANEQKETIKELTDHEIGLLAQNTHMSKDEIIQWHQQFLDQYPKGFINKKQFIDIYKQLYTHGKPEKYAEFAFMAFDNSHDGRISFDEFVMSTAFLIKQGSSREQELERLEMAFDIFDVNDDQKIDKAELTKLYTAIHELKGEDSKYATARVASLMLRFDVDNTGTLNKSEFIQALHGDDIFSFFQ